MCQHVKLSWLQRHHITSENDNIGLLRVHIDQLVSKDSQEFSGTSQGEVTIYASIWACLHVRIRREDSIVYFVTTPKVSALLHGSLKIVCIDIQPMQLQYVETLAAVFLPHDLRVI